jgi:hypothetical protein
LRKNILCPINAAPSTFFSIADTHLAIYENSDPSDIAPLSPEPNLADMTKANEHDPCLYDLSLPLFLCSYTPVSVILSGVCPFQA